MADLTIDDFLRRAAAERPAAEALGTIRNGTLRWLTWQQLVDQVDLLAQQLPPKAVVDLNAADPHSFVLADLAVQRAGGVTLCGGSPEQRTPATHCWQQGQFIELSPPHASIPHDGCGALQFTSGTSGEPLGVMLGAEQLAWNAQSVSETVAAGLGDEEPTDELRLAFLPFRHLFARVCDMYAWIYRGSKLVLAESIDTVTRDAQLVRPTAVTGVPYFFERLLAAHEAKQAKDPKHRLADLFPVQRAYSGGAALSPVVEQRYWDAGLPLLHGYGLTEASPVVSVSTLQSHRQGRVGRPLPGVEVRLEADGELLVRGPNVMRGYWENETATAEALDQGWLRTGDLATIDNEGYLSIVGRKKELLVLSTGYNVAPSRVEALLTASPWIEQACVMGEGEKGLTALIVPNRERLRAEVRRRRLWVWSKRGAVNHRAIRSLYREEIDHQLAEASKAEQIHQFTILTRGFDREAGEMTAKLSLRRQIIAKHLASEIAAAR